MESNENILLREIEELRKVLRVYADRMNWHNNYDIPYDSKPGEGLDVVWARLEDGWELAAKALGEY